ncbi:carbohydrate ABC transporter permease [Ammoniphilus sp. CFH 90114]|uniref:carbohydrate ABC transporter permease n=1 Tax=Ammoniphilus sp. CFH 90114 TaxID=2493665 RepID=UPI00100E63FD|nr:sugar ABC transporter permease [Ammoniphilus sp. CFH 90114]RXT15245.1 sugar ABC transporter permease [Ammoniphilus sp. CFH 90114]
MKLDLSEKHIGYLLVLPALLIIIVIAIWPVVRSFWISLYDIRLNDPTKTEIHSTYGIDLERYVGTMPTLLRAIDREMKQAEPEGATRLESIRENLANLDQVIRTQEQVANRYEEVDQLLYDFRPVPQDLKYASIDLAVTEEIKASLKQMEAELVQVGSENILRKPNDVIGLTRGLQAAVISPNYVGFTYYRQFLTDQRTWTSLTNTLFFTLISVFFELILGLWIALLINKSFKGRGLVRAAVLIPWAIPTVISALMWKFLYDGQNGVVAKFFEAIGLIPDMSVLLTTKLGALFSVIFADVWKTTPFMALLIFAGLQTIPDSLYEAASLDGANKRQQFFTITLPMLKSAILVALLFRTLDAFRVFDLIYVLTGGGPANSTETISIYAYKTMFAQMNFGAGSALSVLVFLCVAVISIGFIKILGADILADGRK